MSLELITAPSFPQLLQELRQQLERSEEARHDAAKWVVVPTTTLADHLSMSRVTEPCKNARVVPVAAFVSQLRGCMDSTSAPRWSPLFDMMLYELVQGMAPDSPLAPIRTTAGGHRLLRPTFLDLADGGFGLDQDELLEEMIQAGDLQPLERATLSLYRSWMRLLRIRDVAWQPFLHQRLPEWILNLQPDHLAGLLGGGPGNPPHLFLYGYYDLTDINTQLVAALTDLMPVTALLPLKREKKAVHRAFGFTQEIAQDLETRAGSLFRERCSHSPPSELTSFFLDTFPEGAIGARPQRLTFQSASGPRAELISAAVRIRSWMDDASAPVQAGQILLLAPQPERYSEMAREVFDDFCIPLQTADPAFSGEARMLEHLARIWERQGDSEWVLSFLRENPQIPLLEGVDVGIFENKIRKLGIWGGEGWERALENTSLSNSLFSSSERLLIGEIRECWVRSLHRDRIPLSDALGLLDRIGRLWLNEPSILEPLLEDLKTLASHSGGLTFRPSFLQSLLRGVTVATAEEASVAGNAVQFLPFMRARGISVRRVVVLGLASGLFPFRIQEDPLLSDASRRRLALLARDLGHRLAIKDRASAEMALLFFLLSTSGQSVHWVIPESDEAGRTLAPTPWVQRYRQQWHSDTSQDPAFARIPRGPVEQALYLLSLDGQGGSLLPPSYAAMLSPLASGPSSSNGLSSTVPGSSTQTVHPLGRWPQVGLTELASKTGETRLSVSGLELLGRCPFRFYAARIDRFQGLQPLLFSERIEALQWGRLLHLLLEKIFQPYAGGDRPLAKIVEELLEGGSHRLRRAVASLPRLLPQTLEVLPQIFERAVLEELASALENYVRSLAEGARGGERPVALEQAISRPFPGLERVRITGKMDWVGKRAGSLHIVDYKSGKMPQQVAKEVELGFRLQPLLYPWLLQQGDYRHHSARFSYAFLGNDPPEMYSPGASPTTGQLLPYFRKVLREGRYLPASKEALEQLGIQANPCQYCDYPSLCRRFDPDSEEAFAAGFQDLFSERFEATEKAEVVQA